MSNTLVFNWENQSNGIGKSTSTSASPGNTAPGVPYYVTTSAGIRVLTWDGFLTPDSWAKKASEPWADPTNAVDGAKHATRIAADSVPSLGAVGPALPFADYLKAGGSPAATYTPIAANIIVIPSGLSATHVSSDWLDAGGFATEPNDQTLLGAAKRRLDAAMLDAPNAQIGAIIMAAGESESAETLNTEANAIQANLGNIMDQWLAYATLRGYTWAKPTCKFILAKMAAGYGAVGQPSGGPPWLWVSTVNTAFDNLAAGRTDCQTFLDAFSGAYIHLDSVDNIVRAAALANLWLAAT